MTKLLILSDSHGGSDAIARILKAERENIDALIFLGDGLRDLELALTKYPRLRTYAVAGNCDFGALEPYDGVTITQDGTVLSVSAGILPDGGAYGGYRGVAAPAGKRYFLRNANTVYDNFSRRGSPDIGEDGVLRNITSGNNIYTAFYNQSYPWEITVKIHTPETFADQSYIFGNYSTNRATPQLCTDVAGHLMLYLASSTSAWDIADGVMDIYRICL